MKAILCALDFTEQTADVIQEALKMALQQKTNLVVLFAYRLLQPMNEDITAYRKNVETKAKADFDAIAKKLKLNGDIPCEFRTEIGFLSDRIDAFVKKNPVGLIVIGQSLAHAISDQKGLSLDSFINDINIPVLIVPEKQPQD